MYYSGASMIIVGSTIFSIGHIGDFTFQGLGMTIFGFGIVCALRGLMT